MSNSPKIAKMIETGETNEILEEIESSVGYYRMQSMNQSLLALLVHGTITYDEAMAPSTDPEDLSLKLRKMFPQIEERGGGHGVGQRFFRDYAAAGRQEALRGAGGEVANSPLGERRGDLPLLQELPIRAREHAEGRAQTISDLEEEIQRLKSDNERVARDYQGKIAQLNERIKELNQRVIGSESGGKVAQQGGFFKK